MVSRKETVKSCCVNILDDVKRILAQPFECRKTSLPDGALHNVQKDLENMINAIDKDIYNPQIEMFARFKMKSSFHKTKRII